MQKTVFFAITIILLLVVPVAAQAPADVTVRFAAQTDTLTVGDPVALTLQATYPADYQIDLPELPQAWGNLEVLSQSAAQTVTNADGAQTTTQVVQVTAFAPGAFSTPELAVSFTDGAGKTISRVAPPITLTVQSVLVKEDTALRDIKPQAQLPVPPVWPWILAGLALAALLGWGGWRLYRYLKPRLARAPGVAVAAPVLDLRPPHQIALEELARIEGLDLPGQGRFKEYYSLVSECQRRYLQGVSDLAAMDLTTDEIRAGLKQTGIEAARARAFVALFSVCDLVKFARFIPTREEAGKLISQARALIEVAATVPEGV